MDRKLKNLGRAIVCALTHFHIPNTWDSVTARWRCDKCNRPR